MLDKLRMDMTFKWSKANVVDMVGSLQAGASVGRTTDELALGELSLACSIYNIQGNGLADAGDRMDVTAKGADAFDPDTAYTLSIVYTITELDIFAATFIGAAQAVPNCSRSIISNTTAP